ATINEGTVMKQGWFDQKAVRVAFDAHRRGTLDASNLLFNVAQLDAWFQLHENDWQKPASLTV
ncbi:MAG: hypothetical protein IT353_16675, partial [Gemmatimonadaceae bacterium]|nr:hypothetical protein [Gemmatimonadaceae bacterium]